MIDLRSDTVTQPTAQMREVMAHAEVDDDVIDVDPTVARLQQRIAQLLDKEAAIFMPSGTMTNQVAVRIHCRPGDEFICEAGCHIYNYEQGAYAQLSGVAARPVQGDCGVLRLADVEPWVRPLDDHQVRTRLLCLENTHNRGAGRILPCDEVERLCRWARQQGLATHLDGARLFNAAVATGLSVHDWAQHFDTVSVCFSKGLGAPVGSALAGSREQIVAARRHRKVLGGGMRQSGILAAAALYALDHHVDRLRDDHEHARWLAEAIRQSGGLQLDPPHVDTNIVIFRVASPLGSARDFVARLAAAGVRALAIGPSHVRLVTHLGVSALQSRQAAEVLRKLGAIQ